jgi:hypothetical protein
VGLEFTNYYTPVLRALHLRRALSFDYQSSTNKNRLVEPLSVGLFNGATYSGGARAGDRRSEGLPLHAHDLDAPGAARRL